MIKIKGREKKERKYVKRYNKLIKQRERERRTNREKKERKGE